MIPIEWQYRKPEDIRDLLRDKATRDTATGQSIVYASILTQQERNDLRKFTQALVDAAEITALDSDIQLIFCLCLLLRLGGRLADKRRLWGGVLVDGQQLVVCHQAKVPAPANKYCNHFQK